MGYLGLGAGAGSPRWVGKSTACPLHPCFKPPSQRCHPAPPHPPARPSFPALPPAIPGSHPGPSSALLWHPFLLFILPNWRPTPAAPQCAPHPVQQILRKARPALAAAAAGRGQGPGRAGRRSRSPSAPRVSGADRAGWAGPPGGRAGGRRAGRGGGAVSGSRRRWRCPGARVPESARPGEGKLLTWPNPRPPQPGL